MITDVAPASDLQTLRSALESISLCDPLTVSQHLLLERAIAFSCSVPFGSEGFAEAQDCLAFALYRTGRMDEALSIGRARLRSNPPTAISFFVVGKCLASLGKYAHAEAAFLSIPNTPDYIVARAQIMRGQTPSGGQFIKSVVGSFWSGYGDILKKQGWYEQALIESASSLDEVLPSRCPDTLESSTKIDNHGPSVTLVSFSGNEHFRGHQVNLAQSAVTVGEIDRAILWTETSLRGTKYYRSHKTILSLPRGAGCWSWKPFLIYNELLQLREGDYVIYYDCGRKGNRLTHSVRNLIDWCERDSHGIIPGAISSEGGPSKHLTKRDCFYFMGCDDPKFWDHPQVAATFSVWRNSPFARKFLHEWSALCLDPRINTDYPNVCGLPNHEGFLDHRHDQSILTNLVIHFGLESPCLDSKDINQLSGALLHRG